MANHIRVRKVDDDHIIFVRFDCLYKLLANLRCTHLRLHIVGRNLRGFYKDSVLSFVWLLNTTVEEECNMCIFLCLGDTCLCHIVSCKVLTEGIVKKNLVECYQLILDGIIILCEAYECGIQSLCSLKALKIVITESSCDLSCTVRTEVEEYNGILIRNSCNRFAVLLDNSRKHKFICLVIIIGSLNCCCSICSLYAFALCKSFICKLNTIPAVITIHCIITSGDHTDLTNADLFHFSFQLLYKLFTGCRRCVTSIQEAVYVNFLESLSLCHLKKSVEMCIVAVYATVRKKSHKMNRGIVVFCILHSRKKCLILEEIAVLDLFCDPCKLLVYDTACAHVHMTNLGVTHLSVRKTYRKTAGIAFYKRIIFHESVHNRCFCLIYSISVMSVIESVSIKDH